MSIEVKFNYGINRYVWKKDKIKTKNCLFLIKYLLRFVFVHESAEFISLNYRKKGGEKLKV